jgi:hypothetical protein
VDVVVAVRIARRAAALPVAEPGLEIRRLERVGAQRHPVTAAAHDLSFCHGQEPGSQAMTALVVSHPEQVDVAVPAPRPPVEPSAQVTAIPAGGHAQQTVRSSSRSFRGDSRRPLAPRHVFEDPAEVAEAHGGIYPLGHLGRLQACGPAPAGARVVDLRGGQRGAQSAPPGPLDRSYVVAGQVARPGWARLRPDSPGGRTPARSALPVRRRVGAAGSGRLCEHGRGGGTVPGACVLPQRPRDRSIGSPAAAGAPDGDRCDAAAWPG